MRASGRIDVTAKVPARRARIGTRSTPVALDAAVGKEHRDLPAEVELAREERERRGERSGDQDQARR